MVRDSIKIYARLKQENPAKTATYEVLRTENNETITFRFKNVGDFVNNKPQTHRFRFEKVFDQFSTQDEVFDSIAKPVVNSVLRGFNGTIFAYGQTGSGKTYAITGSSDYEGRGIIPRSIEEIFEFIKKAPDTYTIYISYLEIYNEIGYDLLNPKQQISSLDELPLMDVANYLYRGSYYQILHSDSRKVILLEDGKGESHLRNLSMQKVSNEQEAMRLLFLGDTNRTITETPMNVYSSRSHCIFTICITSTNSKSGKIRKSKLNLVDLAGSERINKSNISGTTLNEAKYINLSLHYLEQVILALSQRRAHVPFRNSMLTYMLRDSLSGNCKTVLLATLAVNKKNIEETIATCKFAQRVAEVNMEAVINEEIDPQQEIEYLRNEVESLRKQLMYQSKFRMSGKLTKEEKENWKNVINNYLSDTKDELPLTNFDMRHIQYCFKLLKETIKERDQKLKLVYAEEKNKQLAEQYKQMIKEKEEEISTLKSLLYGETKSQPKNFNRSSNIEYLEQLNCSMSFDQEKENIPPLSDSLTLSTAQKIAFEIFLKDPKNTVELDHYRQSIQDMYEVAKKLTLIVEQCQNKILALRAKDQGENRVTTIEIDLELLNQQSIYRNSLSKLQELKRDTEELRIAMERAKRNMLENFQQWYNGIANDNNVENNFETQHWNETRNIYRSRNLTSSVDKKFTSSSSEDLRKENASHCFRETHKIHLKDRSKSPLKYGNDRVEEPWKYTVDDSCSRPEMGYCCKQRSRSRSKSPFSSITHKFEDFLKTGAEESCGKFMKSCFWEEETSGDECRSQRRNRSKSPQGQAIYKSCLQKENETEDQFRHQTRTRSRSPPQPEKYMCEVLWKKQQEHFEITSRADDENISRHTNQNRNRFESPQRCHNLNYDSSLVYNTRLTSQKPSSGNNNDNFSVVYHDIMGCNNSFGDNVHQLISERPYSSESNKRASSIEQHLKPKIYENQLNEGLNKFAPPSKYRKSLYSNNPQFEENNYGMFLKNCKKHEHSEEEEREEGRGRAEEEAESFTSTSNSSKEKMVLIKRDLTNVYEERNHMSGVQNCAKIWDTKHESISLANAKTNENNSNFKAALNQKLPSYQHPLVINEHYTDEFEKICRVENKNTRENLGNNSRGNRGRSGNSLFLREDSQEFRDFVSTIPLTGDTEVDEEIIKFYRTKFACTKNI